jgi:hypothetical protein
MAIWYNLWLVGIFTHFGIIYQEKSGTPVSKVKEKKASFDKPVREWAGTPGSTCKTGPGAPPTCA